MDNMYLKCMKWFLWCNSLFNCVSYTIFLLYLLVRLSKMAKYVYLKGMKWYDSNRCNSLFQLPFLFIYLQVRLIMSASKMDIILLVWNILLSPPEVWCNSLSSIAYPILFLSHLFKLSNYWYRWYTWCI